MTALARLIEDVRAAHGWNQSEVARRVGVNRSRIGQFVNQPLKAVPTQRMILALARGLGVPSWVVMDAVLESLGLPTRPNHIGIAEAVASDVHLSAGDKRAILAFVDHIRAQPAAPDLDSVEGIRLAEDEESAADAPNGRNGTAR